MKKLFVMMLVVAMVLGLTVMAHGEEAATPAYNEAMQTVKTFTAKGSIEGQWTLSLQKDDSGLYPCSFDMGDGRVVVIPLNDDELDELLYQAIDEIHQKIEEEDNETDDRTFIAKAVDWVIFWN